MPDLVCVECGRTSTGSAEGWRSLLGGGYDIGELEAPVYCPGCAQAEFGDGEEDE